MPVRVVVVDLGLVLLVVVLPRLPCEIFRGPILVNIFPYFSGREQHQIP